jgi:hypothetical protein
MFLITMFFTLQIFSCKQNQSEYNSKEILIKFKTNINPAEIDSLVKEIGLEKIKDIPRIEVTLYKILSELSVDEIIKKYGTNPHIEFIEPNYSYKTDKK